MSNKKVVIIGGGISGLTAGVYAAKAGFVTEVYEKNVVAGGECTGWDRQGYHIDNCIHWLMGTVEGTGLYKIWKDIGAVGDDVEILTFDTMYTSELNGEELSLWSDMEKTQKQMIELSPEDEAEIKKLMKYVEIGKGVEIPCEKPPEMMTAKDGIKMAISMKQTMKMFKDFAGQDTFDLMNKFKHPLIRCLISDFCPKDSLASSFPMAYGNFVAGDGGLPKGGSRALALRIQEKIQQLGGKVITGAPVAEIKLELEEKAKGIRLENGEFVEADYIICACDTDYTFGYLLDKKYMDPILKEMYNNRKAYPVYGMFQVAYAVDSEINAIDGERMLESGDIKTADWMGDRITVKSYSYEPGFAPHGKQIVQVLFGLQEEAYDYWLQLYQNKEEYKHEKEKLAKAIMNKLENRFPEYKGKMSILDIWTPMTYKRWCNAYKGYNQSFTITKNSAKNPYPSAYIKGIDNVILAGQWLSPPGGLPGAAIQGKYAIQRILKREKRDINI